MVAAPFPWTVKETFLWPFRSHSGSDTPTTPDCHCWNKAPVIHGCPPWLAAHPTPTVREKFSLPAQLWVSHSSGGRSVTARAAPGRSDRKGSLTLCCWGWDTEFKQDFMSSRETDDVQWQAEWRNSEELHLHYQTQRCSACNHHPSLYSEKKNNRVGENHKKSTAFTQTCNGQWC